LTVTVSASEEETHYAQSTSVTPLRSRYAAATRRDPAATAGEEREKARRLRHAMSRSLDPSAIDTLDFELADRTAPRLLS